MPSSKLLRVRSDSSAAVLVDAPVGVNGAGPLGVAIADRVRAGGVSVSVADQDWVLQAGVAMRSGPRRQEPDAGGDERPRRDARVLLALVGTWRRWRHCAEPWRCGMTARSRRRMACPMTLLVEGRVGVRVPAQWRRKRITDRAGFGSGADVSPADHRTALHITQSSLLPADQSRQRWRSHCARARRAAGRGVRRIQSSRPQRGPTRRDLSRDPRGTPHRGWCWSTTRSASASAARARRTAKIWCATRATRPSSPLMRCSENRLRPMEPNRRLRRRQTVCPARTTGKDRDDDTRRRTLNTDFDLMTAVAGKIDARNEEIRAMLQSFIGRMSSVPHRCGAASPRRGSGMSWTGGTRSR